MSGTPTSNENDAKSINKLALLASAAATAAFVISQTRLMQRLTEPPAASSTATLPPPQPAPRPLQIDPEEDSADASAEASSNGHNAEAATNHVAEFSADNSGESHDHAGSDQTDDSAIAPRNGHSLTPAAPELAAVLADPNDSVPDDEPDRDDDITPPRPSGGVRLRFHGSRTQRERLHYGLPVSKRRRPRTTTRPVSAPPVRTAPQDEDAPRVEPAAVAVLEAPPAPVTTYAAPRVETDDFDAEYLAICEAIARDGRADYEDEPEDEIVVAAASAPRDAIEDIWWLPAPRVRYLLLMLVYVAISAAVGSDPVTLAADGVRALTTVDSASDFVLLAWALCGAVVVLPLGGLAVWLVSKLSLGKLRAPRFESAGWGIRLLATSAFIAGAVLYTPDALALALDTDYPVAAVSSDSMSPALQEGELVFLRGVDHPGELKVGDIIAFKYNGGLAVRRVVGFENDAIVTQADAAPNEHVLVKLESIAGKAIHLAGTQVKLPLLGNISLLGERTVDPVGSPLSSLP